MLQQVRFLSLRLDCIVSLVGNNYVRIVVRVRRQGVLSTGCKVPGKDMKVQQRVFNTSRYVQLWLSINTDCMATGRV